MGTIAAVALSMLSLFKTSLFHVFFVLPLVLLVVTLLLIFDSHNVPDGKETVKNKACI